MTRRRALSTLSWILIAVAVVAAIGITVALLRFNRPAVTVTEAVEGPAVQAFYATGTLEPADREHVIRAPVEGFIRPPTPEQSAGKAYMDKGHRVGKGQVLAVVYNEGYQSAYDKALADVKEKTARAREETSPVLQELDSRIANYGELVKASEREFQRYSRSLEQNVAAQSDYDRALDRWKTLVSEFEAFKAQKLQAVLRLERELADARSALKIAEWNLEQTKILSPVDGFVMDKPLQIGARVAINDLIVTVANSDPSNLVMRAQVDEEDVTKVTPEGFVEQAFQPASNPASQSVQAGKPAPQTQPVVGQVVRMSLYSFPDEIFTGRVLRIYPKADPERRTFEVDVAIEKPSPRMQSGMTGELAFETASRDRTLVVPSQALQEGKIWTIRGGKFADSGATVGLRGVERIEVTSGLKPGDTVVISPIAGLVPGDPVRVGEKIDPATAAGLNKPKAKEIFRGGF